MDIRYDDYENVSEEMLDEEEMTLESGDDAAVAHEKEEERARERRANDRKEKARMRNVFEDTQSRTEHRTVVRKARNGKPYYVRKGSNGNRRVVKGLTNTAVKQNDSVPNYSGYKKYGNVRSAG